ncbi:MAG: hypothetical protein ACRDAJ_17170 [Serratia fonticola]
MTRIKFLYIDDDSVHDLRRQIDEITNNSNDRLEIVHHNPIPMRASLELINHNNYDGVIIDQKLDIPSSYNNVDYVADYFGAALAQNLRTHMAAGTAGVSSIPIILMSNEKNLVDYYDPDETSHNLFDLVIKKMDLTIKGKGEYYANYMVSLVESYRLLKNAANMEQLLACDQSILDLIDPRFIAFIESKNRDPYATTAAISSTLIKSAGILTTELMLATKLGIDIDSSPGWENIKDALEPFRYRGVFSTIKDRWWFVKIEDWWEQYDNVPSLQSIGASERVAILKKRLDIESLNPIPKKYANQSEKFWVNCVVTNAPLDIYDAMRAECLELKPWEQAKYLDITAVLSMAASNAGYKVHPEDRYKVNVLKQRLVPDGR